MIFEKGKFSVQRGVKDGSTCHRLVTAALSVHTGI